MKIVLIGAGQHGKDTVGKLIEKHGGLKCTSSSEAALELFLFDLLSEKHGYKTIQEAYENRHKNRKEWYEAIQQYNTPDKTRLACDIMKSGDVYVGMRDPEELHACLEAGIFDFVVGVYDPRKPLETHSKVVNVHEDSDYLIYNDKGLEELEIAVIDFLKTFHILK